jgi:hypothetical protein
METELENLLISTSKEEVITYLQKHPLAFDEALTLAVADKQPYSWRAAWLLAHCMNNNDARIFPYVGQLIAVIPNKKDGHQRELLKILLRMDVDENHEGSLFTVCTTLWEAVEKTPSVRYTAFKCMLKTATHYPELINELKLLTEERYMDSLSLGIKRSLLKMASKAI